MKDKRIEVGQKWVDYKKDIRSFDVGVLTGVVICCDDAIRAGMNLPLEKEEGA